MDADNAKKTDNAAGAPKAGGEWTKEQPGRDRPFDFDAFLGQRSLEDQVTDALDGKDLLDGEAYGQYPPGYIPRRAGAADGRGRHEAPGSDPEPEPGPAYPGEPPTQRFTREGEIIPPRQSQPQQTRPPQQSRPSQQDRPPQQSQPPRPQRPVNEPPPRPKVVVAEPAPRVVVTPERQYNDEPTKKGMGKGAKFFIALLITVAVVLALGVLALQLLPGGAKDPDAPAPSPTDYLFGGLPTRAPQAPTAPPAPTTPPETPTPMPTPAPVTWYTVSVTAGPGGSVSPNGMVDVQEGESVSFTITPDPGYNLAQLLIDGVSVSVVDFYCFNDVRQSHTLYAVFQPAPATQPPATDVPVTDVPVIPEEPVLPDTPVTPEEPVVPDVPPISDLPPAVAG